MNVFDRYHNLLLALSLMKLPPSSTSNEQQSSTKQALFVRREWNQENLFPGRRTQSSTCSFDGITYQAGENLGDSFQTRCGSSFPCYCSPNRNPPVECPYCSMADADQGLVCAKDGETVSIVNLNGIPQSCSCSVSIDGIAQESCVDVDNDDNDNQDEDFCTIQVVDGTTMMFENGESLGEFLPTRCPGGGLAFPCFCNTALVDQIDCPYCTWLDYRGDLICARQAESVVYEKAPGEYLECACLSDFISTCKPMAPSLPPTLTPPPTIKPTSQSTPLPTNPPTFSPPSSLPQSSPTPTISTTSPPTSQPTFQLSPSLPEMRDPTISPTQTVTFDKNEIREDDRPPMPEPNLGGCLFFNQTTGELEFIEEGKTFGPNVHGPCSPTEDWPVVCNPSIPSGGMEYPYCIFSSASFGSSPSSIATTSKEASRTNDSLTSGFVCAKSEERVLVTLNDGTSHECSCLYFNPLLGPSSSCPMVEAKLSMPGFYDEDDVLSDDEKLSPDQAPQSSFSPSSDVPRRQVTGAIPVHVLSFFIIFANLR